LIDFIIPLFYRISDEADERRKTFNAEKSLDQRNRGYLNPPSDPSISESVL